MAHKGKYGGKNPTKAMKKAAKEEHMMDEKGMKKMAKDRGMKMMMK